MKIVLCGVGSHGDIHPLLGLGTALLARGHAVSLCAAVNYAAAAARAGLGFRSMGTSIEQLVKEHGESVFSPLRFLDLARRLAQEQLDNTLAATAGADVVVGGAACFVGPTAAELSGARFHWATFAPGTFPTATAPFLLAGFSPERRWLNTLTHGFGNAAMAHVLMKVLNPLRRRHGLKPVAGYDDAVYVCDALYAVDAAVDAVPPDWKVRARQTGFWCYDDGAAFDPAVDAFLDAGDAPIYVGFGSMPVNDPAARTRAIVDGLLRAGRRGIISSGWAGLGAGFGDSPGAVALPPTILRVGPVSHARLFPRCAAVVHHCGAGTTAAALRAGVPQVPVPHAYDQPTWARRLAALGVATRRLPRRFDAAALAAALGDVDDRVARAAALGRVLRQSDGAAVAADLIAA